MSRSNPTDNSPNPSTRWFEWDGSEGNIRYYDKTTKGNVTVDLPFTFMLLDQLACVKGWHDSSESGIFSNEVKDTRAETLVVKAFKGGVLAEGFYSAIRDKIIAQGGHFTSNCYIAFKPSGDDSEDATLAIGSLQFKGAALSSWMEFAKKRRADLYTSAIRITGFHEGKKGKIIFRVPTFALVPVSDEANAQATELDRELQEYLKSYFGRTRVEQAAPVNGAAEHPQEEALAPAGAAPEDDEIPF